VPFELVIVTPQGEAFRGEVESAVLPGVEGEFGVLPSHERFLTPLRVGEIEIRTATGTLVGAMADGFAEVKGDEVAVLVDSCELATDIDVARAELAHERAEQGLAALGVDEDAERFSEYESALARARTRIAVAQKS
jgi:F-type H+-transporting ATPase subunit epsilon